MYMYMYVLISHGLFELAVALQNWCVCNSVVASIRFTLFYGGFLFTSKLCFSSLYK